VNCYTPLNTIKDVYTLVGIDREGFDDILESNPSFQNILVSGLRSAKTSVSYVASERTHPPCNRLDYENRRTSVVNRQVQEP
jgi:hypothetical protein